MSSLPNGVPLNTIPAPMAPAFPSAVAAAALARLLQEADRALPKDAGEVRRLLARASEMLLPPATQQGRAGNGRLAPWQERRVITHIEQNLHEPLRIEHLAASVRLSASYFARAFKASFGATPHDYLLGVRIQRAQLLLLDREVPLAQIALDCGMCDQAHLSRVFRRATGASPSAWRRHHAVPA